MINFKKLIWLVPALVWLGVMFLFSGQSAEESGQLSGWFTDLLMRIMPFIRSDRQLFESVLRKITHFGIFAVEGSLLLLGFEKIAPRLWRNVTIAIAFSAAAAVFNELHQLTSPGRVCSPIDMLIDTSGAVCGAVFAAVIWLLLKRYNVFSRRGTKPPDVT